MQLALAIEFDEARSTAAEAVLALRTNQCRYGYGDPLTPNFFFCEETQKRGSSYCTKHDKICNGVQPYVVKR